MGGQRHAPVTLLRERSRTNCRGGWVGLRASPDRCGRSRPHGTRSPDRPARSKSLYRLRFPGPDARQDSSTRCTGPFLSVQWPGLGVKRPTPPSTDVRNGWSYTSFLPSCFHNIYLLLVHLLLNNNFKIFITFMLLGCEGRC